MVTTASVDPTRREGSLEHVGARAPDDGWTLADPLSLSRGSARALAGVVRALLPPPPAPSPVDIETRIATHVRCMLQYMPVGPRFGFIAILHALEYAPLWRGQAWSRLSALPAERASRVLAGLSASRLWLFRLLLLGPKALVMSTYFDQDEVHAALCYEPRAFMRESVVQRAALLQAKHSTRAAS